MTAATSEKTKAINRFLWDESRPAVTDAAAILKVFIWFWGIVPARQQCRAVSQKPIKIKVF